MCNAYGCVDEEEEGCDADDDVVVVAADAPTNASYCRRASACDRPGRGGNAPNDGARFKFKSLVVALLPGALLLMGADGAEGNDGCDMAGDATMLATLRIHSSSGASGNMSNPNEGCVTSAAASAAPMLSEGHAR